MPTEVPTFTSATLSEVVFKRPSLQLFHDRHLESFHINRIEDARQGMTFPMPPHRKIMIDFIVVTRGQLIRHIGLTSYVVPAGSFIFLPAYQISFDEWMSDDIQGYYCHFTPELLSHRWQKEDIDKAFTFLRFHGQSLITPEPSLFNDALLLVSRLERAYINQQCDSFDLLRLYLLTLLTELTEGVASAQLPETLAANAAVRLTQAYKNALARFIYKKQTVSDYASLLNISPNHLNKCVKMATGQSARDLLDEMILLEAKYLLTQTDLTIGEIAYKIGQQEPGNFTRYFKNKTGITPRDFRLRGLCVSGRKRSTSESSRYREPWFCP
jgi:AraC family transcriptional activator of pobA